MTIKAIRGFKDILPAETPLWREIEAAALRVLDNFGFKEIRIPILEKTELFARSIGEDTDIVEKEMFTFPDRHGDPLTLRPEATAGVLRAVLEHSLAGDGRPLKVFVIGPMFRYERPQKGRQRQFHQLDVETFNDPSGHADAEIIVLLAHFLEELGLTGVTMNVNSLGCPEDRPVYKQRLLDYLSGNKDELCPDCRRRLNNNPLRVIDCKSAHCQEIVKGAPSILDTLCQDCRDHFDQVQAGLTQAKLNFEVNPRLVRGLDYYCRTTFEALTGDLGAQNAVAGGGRYDGLSKILGGPDMPATGFALGLERLAMLLADQGAGPDPSGPDLFVANLTEEATAAAAGPVWQLRKNGWKVEMEYAPAGLKNKMKRAGKLNAARVWILGPEELANHESPVRDMRTQEQTTISLADDVASALTDILNKE